MPSENKTPLGLSQWIGGDRPKMADFNSDNQKIDLACRSVLAGLSEHLESDVHPGATAKQRWDTAAVHSGEGVAGPDGMHGLRYYGGLLEVNVGGAWQPCVVSQQSPYKVYGVQVDIASSDPAAVVYTDAAVGMTPAGPGWADTFLGSIRPCVLRGGAVVRYLRESDYCTGVDGQPADIASGAEGDVMIEIPRMAYAIYEENDKLCVKITDHPDAISLDSRFCYNAHTRAVQGDRQKLYVGAYLGSLLGGRLRSLSGKYPGLWKSFHQFRQLAQQNGDGYDLLGFYPYTLLQCLTLIRLGTRDAQAALGRGYTYTQAGALNTGGCDKKGMFFGEQTGGLQMKQFGVEDFWGNAFYFLDGLWVEPDGTLRTATRGFGSGAAEVWRGVGHIGRVNKGTAMRVWGSCDGGFLPLQTGGLLNQYWCDESDVYPESVVCVGGDRFIGLRAGPFGMWASVEETDSTDYYGARLMYL